MGIEIKNPERTELRLEFLHGIFTTALEGGIGYWSVCDEYHWSNKADAGNRCFDLVDFYAIIESNEDDWGVTEAYISEQGQFQPITETQTLRIDLDVIERGANMLVEKVLTGEFTNPYLLQFVVAWVTNGDQGDYDSCGADLAVQLGLFGEVVYA